MRCSRDTKPRPLVALEVTHGVEAREHAHEGREHEDERRQAVHAQRPAEGRRRLSREVPPGGGQGEDERGREAAEEDGFLGPAGAGDGPDGGGGEGNGERREEEVHLSP